MHQNYEVCYYIQELRKIIAMQNEHIRKMGKDIQLLQKEIESLKKNKSFTIEKIEYKFDQLKVETLSGTLNIGITPGSSASIEELNIEGEVKEDLNFPKTKLHIEMFKNIIEQVDDYLNTGILNEIQIQEKRYNKTLDNDKREHIINDLRKQLEKQINAYVNQKKDTITPENIEAFENDIVKKLIEDINKALEVFIKSFPKEID